MILKKEEGLTTVGLAKRGAPIKTTTYQGRRDMFMRWKGDFTQGNWNAHWSRGAIFPFRREEELRRETSIGGGGLEKGEFVIPSRYFPKKGA